MTLDSSQTRGLDICAEKTTTNSLQHGVKLPNSGFIGSTSDWSSRRGRTHEASHMCNNPNTSFRLEIPICEAASKLAYRVLASRLIMIMFSVGFWRAFKITYLAVAGAKPAEKPQSCIVHEAATTPCRGRRGWLGARSRGMSPSVYDDIDVVLLTAESRNSR